MKNLNFLSLNDNTNPFNKGDNTMINLKKIGKKKKQ